MPTGSSSPDRRSADHPDRAGSEHWRAPHRRREDKEMNELSVNVEVPRAHFPPMGLAEARAKVTARDLNFYYGDHHALKNITSCSAPTASRRSSVPPVAASRPCCASSTGCTISIPASALKARWLLDDTNILDPRIDPQPAARAHRHGVPEADAVPDDDLRETSRSASAPVREDLEVGDWNGPRRGGAARRRALTEDKNKLNAQRAQACPAAISSAVHRRTVAVRPRSSCSTSRARALDRSPPPGSRS